MENPKVGLIIVFLVAAAALAGGLIGIQVRDQGTRSGSPAGTTQADPSPGRNILRATYDPIHFKPAIESARDEQCLACHGSFETVAARTANVKPQNPHSSPHGNTYTACDLCHHQHAKSENFCAQCHNFKFVVP